MTPGEKPLPKAALCASTAKPLAAILTREANNFDLLRLLAASAVIWGHSFYISKREGTSDPVRLFLGFDYSGGLAVTVFFFLSGMFVLNSYQKRPGLFRFLAARFARIAPGLAVCLLVSILVVGPLFTALPMSDYLTRRETVTYFTSNFLLTHLQWNLPGVFVSSIYGVNGSLWTLPLEIRLYLLVAILGWLGVLRCALAANLLLAGTFVAWALRPGWFSYIYISPDLTRASGSFLLGCIAVTNQARLRLSWGWLAPAVLIGTFLFGRPAFAWVLYPTLFYFVLLLFSSRAALKMRIPGDYSYGMYIYGFVVQQCVVHFQARPNPFFNFAVSLPLALALGVTSWHFVEKPALNRCARWFSGRTRGTRCA